MSLKSILVSIILLFCSVPAVNGRQKVPDTTYVQLCLLIDVSSSMEDLLYQAQTQIWDVADEITRFRKKKTVTQVELALISLGNSLYPQEKGYMLIDADFTRDRHALADKLFTLSASGGEELFPQAIQLALDKLAWKEDAAYKVIIVAGNEDFEQGDVGTESLIGQLKQNDILVNTVYCGMESEGIEKRWQWAAEQAGGAFTSIPIKAVANKETPFDKHIVRLYKQYLDSYGDSIKGKRIEVIPRQKVSPAYRDLMLNRFLNEPMPMDLIDHFDESGWNFDAIQPKDWPDELRKLDDRGRKEFLVKKVQERNNARDGITVYQQKIEELLNVQKQPEKEDMPELKEVLIEVIRRQLKTAGFKTRK